MPIRPSRKLASKSSATVSVVPSGAPAWVTPELIQKTLAVWQPYYERELIPEDALEIIMGASQLFHCLSEGHSHEAVRRIGPREQP